MGLQARLMTQAMRKLTAIVVKSKTGMIFINRISMKIGVMFGNPETTTGGDERKFYCSIRVDLQRITTIEEDTGSVGDGVHQGREKQNRPAFPRSRIRQYVRPRYLLRRRPA